MLKNVPQTKAGFDMLVRSKISSMKQSISLGNDALAQMYLRDIMRFVEVVNSIRPRFLTGMTPEQYIKDMSCR